MSEFTELSIEEQTKIILDDTLSMEVAEFRSDNFGNQLILFQAWDFYIECLFVETGFIDDFYVFDVDDPSIDEYLEQIILDDIL